MPPLSWWKTDTAIWPSATDVPWRDDAERRRILVGAAQQVGPALFYSLIIIVVSFLPVFLLEAQEGRMFRPLAWTKTLVAHLSPRCSPSRWFRRSCRFCLRGKLRPESKNPAARFHPGALSARAALVPQALEAGHRAEPCLPGRYHSSLLPPRQPVHARLYEGSALYMPSALPGISITQAVSLMQEQDRIIRSFPEVATVFGTVGRSDSATDNAPLDMYDTTIMLKPRDQVAPRHDLRKADPARWTRSSSSQA
jgi:Cu(I)/Ag(I) efflux system membrane protein CusA/SilA